MATTARVNDRPSPPDLIGATFLTLYREGHTQQLITHQAIVVAHIWAEKYLVRCECGYEYTRTATQIRNLLADSPRVAIKIANQQPEGSNQ